MTPTQGEHAQTEALLLAEWLEFAATNADMGRKPQASDHRRRAAAALRRLHAQVAALTAQPAAPQGVAYAEPSEFPAGAIVNGRTHIDRLESFYRFDCEAGPLINCDDWHGLKRCFEHLAERASHGQAPAGAAQQSTLSRKFSDFIDGSAPPPTMDGWPKLERPAALHIDGSATFGKGVSARLLVEAAYRNHERTLEMRAKTPQQRVKDEAQRRAVWDLINGPIATQPAPTAQAAPAAGAVAGPVNRIPLLDENDPGCALVRTTRGWDFRRNGNLIRHLNLYERLFVESALAAAPTPAAQANSQPAPLREGEREAFKAAHRHLELDEVPDAWGRPMFKHSHVEASWLGWISRAARAPADSVLEDAARLEFEMQHGSAIAAARKQGGA